MRYVPVIAAVALGAVLVSRAYASAATDAEASAVDTTDGTDPGSTDQVDATDAPEVAQIPSTLDTIMTAITPSTYAGSGVDDATAGANARAFLDMLSVSEGTSGPNGYRTLFGGGTFDSFEDHPRQLITRTFRNGKTVTSSAAGRYQFLMRTWDDLAKRLNLPDFSPASQDAAALELIRQRGATADVQGGRFSAACTKCKNIWASLPGAGYGQPENSLERLALAYTQAGGSITTEG